MHPEKLKPLIFHVSRPQVKIYTALPLRALSRLWGRVNSVGLPEWLRSPALRSYVWAFGCDLDEAAVRDLKHYKNLGEFFRRRLKPDVRPIDEECSVVGSLYIQGVVE